MPLDQYGVLKGNVVDRLWGRYQANPHYQIHVIDEQLDYRVAVNVKSKVYPSELKYIILDEFEHPLVEELRRLPLGFTVLDSEAGGLALDYIRGNLFNPQHMEVLPHDLPGPDNDLNERLDYFILKAIDEPDAVIYAFGEPWGPENKKDSYFGFKPGHGIHNVHMNQGNVEQWKQDDGVWQDGGLVFYYPSEDRFAAFFLAFQSQSFHTDDWTGPRLAEVIPQEGAVYIAAALVNPHGSVEAGNELVTLVNISDQVIDVGGWMIADRLKRKEVIQDGLIEAGQFLQVRLSGENCLLSNKGGIISLLDKEGFKMDGVTYTAEQAAKSGWTILF